VPGSSPIRKLLISTQVGVRLDHFVLATKSSSVGASFQVSPSRQE
jgi:hypothetical protein